MFLFRGITAQLKYNNLLHFISYVPKLSSSFFVCVLHTTTVILQNVLVLQVKKFMVGYEMLAQSQRDLTAEQVSDL